MLRRWVRSFMIPPCDATSTVVLGRFVQCAAALCVLVSCEARELDRTHRPDNTSVGVKAAQPPSVGKESPASEPRPNGDSDESAFQRWAERHSADRPSGVTFSEIAVYGADDSSPRPAVERDARVVLRFDSVAVYRRGELPAGDGLPRRLVLDLDGVKLGEAVKSVLPVGKGGLARVRAFALDEDRIRVSFDVGETTAYRLFFLNNPFRIVMDFRDQERAKRPIDTGQPLIVVLDPGHGGEQPGAKGPNGLKESHVALALALRVRNALLHQLPGTRVVMTRSEDHFVTLEERAAIANAVDADLFVSIHLNASTVADELGGVATFVLDTTNDEAALRLAARENGTDVEGVTQLQLILASLYRKEQVEHSRVLAEGIQEATLRGGRTVIPDLNDRGVKPALFYVLVGAQMPAVLVEASFITRDKEAEALATEPYRQALAEGIAQGIVRYVERERLARAKK